MPPRILTQQQAREIRELHASGKATRRQLAWRFEAILAWKPYSESPNGNQPTLAKLATLRHTVRTAPFASTEALDAVESLLAAVGSEEVGRVIRESECPETRYRCLPVVDESEEMDAATLKLVRYRRPGELATSYPGRFREPMFFEDYPTSAKGA